MYMRDESSNCCLVQVISIRCEEKVSEAKFEIKNIYTLVLVNLY